MTIDYTQAAKDYLDRMPKTDMERKYGIKFDSIRVALNRLGIKRGLPKVFANSRKFSEDEILSRYLNGETALSISTLCNRSIPAITRILKKNKIEMRSPSIRTQRYKVDDSYFDSIDTEVKAYFLGWICADGNVFSKRNTITIAIHLKDIDILQKLRDDIKSERPLQKVKRINSQYSDRVSLVITNKKLCNSILKLGIPDKKSLILEFPNIPDELIHHFMRGYFDGDGCIHVGKTIKIDVVGSKFFIPKYQKYLIDNLNLSCTKLNNGKHWHPNTVSLQYSGFNNADKIYNFLYKDASIFLERKYLKFQEMYGKRL